MYSVREYTRVIAEWQKQGLPQTLSPFVYSQPALDDTSEKLAGPCGAASAVRVDNGYLGDGVIRLGRTGRSYLLQREGNDARRLHEHYLCLSSKIMTERAQIL